MSNKTGLSTETLQRMQFAAKQSGTDVATFSNAAFKLGVNVSEGTAKARAGAESLGLSWVALRSASPDDQFNMVVGALEAMEDPQKRNAAAVALFGKTAQEVLPTIVDGYSKAAREATVAGDAQVRALDRAGDAWDRFKQRTQNAFTQAVGSVILLKEATSGLTDEQKAFVRDTDKSIHSIEDLQAAMIRAWQARQKMGKDVNLAAPKPLPPSFTDELKQAAAGYAALSAAQRSQIDAALQMGKSNDDIINSLNITEGVLSVAKKAMEDHKSAMSKAAEEAKKYADVLARVHGATVPLTLVEQERVRTLEALKVSTADIAAYLHVTEAAVSTYTASLKEQSKEIAEIGKQINNLPHNVQLHLQSRDLSGPATLVKGGTQLDPNGIDWKAIADNNNMYLTSMAQKAQATYDYMKAHSSEFSEATIRHFKTIADEAQHAADGTKSAWDRAYSAFGDVATILDNIHGRFAEIGAVAARTGQAIMKNLADGNIWGAVVAGATGALQVFTKLFSTAGRDAVKNFASSMGGFEALHAKLADLGKQGEQLWINLTQGVGRNNPQQAAAAVKAIQDALAAPPPGTAAGAAAAGYKTIGELKSLADQAQKTYEYMRDSGLYTAAAIADAFQKSKDAQVAALGDEAAAATAAMQTAHDNAKAVVDGLDQQLKSLQDSIANEAPEEVMGVVEANTRAQIDAITKQRKDAQDALDQVNTQIQDAADAAVAATQKAAEGAGKATADAVRLALEAEEFHVRVHLDADGNPSGASIPQHGDGAYIREDHVAGVHAGEMIGPESFMTNALVGALQRVGLQGTASRSPQPLVLQIDGMTVARAVLQRQPEVLATYGAGGR
jgi:DNA-binding CsgD family transcriptional regulator